MVKVVIWWHLTPTICYRLVSQMTHVCVHLELDPMQVGWDGLQGWWLMWRWWWCICRWLMLLILLWLLYLPWHAIFFNKWYVNQRLNVFYWCDQYSIELVETYNWGRKLQCLVGLFWVHWVPRRFSTNKLMDNIWNELGHMNTNLLHNVVDQLTFR